MDEADYYTGYKTEIKLNTHGKNPIALLSDAALALNWQLLHLAEDVIVYQTPASSHSLGDMVQISLSADYIHLHVIPENQYYWNEQQCKAIASQLQQELDAQSANHSIEDRSKHPMHREKYGALLVSKTYLVIPLLLYTCTAIYILMIFAGVSPLTPSAKSLFAWGGNFKSAVLHGEWWRLVTYMFLHAGAMHLLMNSYALLYAGMYLEPLIGRVRLISSYLLSGIVAGITSILVHPVSVGVGASGAIFGLYGVFFALLTTNYLQKTAKKTMMRSLLFFVVFNLLMGLQGNTDNAAHIGGLLSGILLGYLFYPGIKKMGTRTQSL